MVGVGSADVDGVSELDGSGVCDVVGESGSADAVVGGAPGEVDTVVEELDGSGGGVDDSVVGAGGVDELVGGTGMSGTDEEVVGVAALGRHGR